MGSGTIIHSCLRKKRYTHEGAVIAAHRMRKNEDAILSVYHCCFCDGYHIGNQQGIGNREKARKLAAHIATVNRENGCKRKKTGGKKKEKVLPPYLPYEQEGFSRTDDDVSGVTLPARPKKESAKAVAHLALMEAQEQLAAERREEKTRRHE